MHWRFENKFPDLYIHNLVKNSKIQIKEKTNMNANKERLGNARSIC